MMRIGTDHLDQLLAANLELAENHACIQAMNEYITNLVEDKRRLEVRLSNERER